MSTAEVATETAQGPAHEVIPFGLSGTQLKGLAALAMTVDHAGAFLFPRVGALRIIGRLAFPIFAFLLVEGCRHTSSRPWYLANVVTFGALTQVVQWLFKHDLHQSIFSTLTLSLLTIFALQWWVDGARDNGKGALRYLNLRLLVPVAMLVVDYLVVMVLPGFIPKHFDFYIQYRLAGVLTPVVAYLPWLTYPHGAPLPRWSARHISSLLLFACGLMAVIWAFPRTVQPWSLLALIPILLYSGIRGVGLPKYAFYLYYPLHLAVIYALGTRGVWG